MSQQRLLSWAARAVPMWASVGVKPSQLRTTPVVGGLSNLLHLVELDDPAAAAAVLAGPPTRPMGHTGPMPARPADTRVLVREFGQEGVVCREDEQIVFDFFAKEGLGPGTMSDAPPRRLPGAPEAAHPPYRAEEFIEAATMTTQQLRDVAVNEAQAVQVAQMHMMKVPLVNREPVVQRLTETLKVEALRVGPQLSGRRGQQWHEFKELFDIEGEVSWVENQLLPHLQRVCHPVDGHDAVGPMELVFSHNDLQEGNWLIIEEGAPFRIIDFEYSGYNFRAYDIANMFCECAYNYAAPEYPFLYHEPDAIPGAEHRRRVWEAYLASADARWLAEHGQSASDASMDARVDAYMRASRGLTLCVQLLWGLWSVVFAKGEQIEFGYMEHGLARVDDYLRVKEKLLRAEAELGTPIAEAGDDMGPDSAVGAADVAASARMVDRARRGVGPDGAGKFDFAADAPRGRADWWK